MNDKAMGIRLDYLKNLINRLNTEIIDLNDEIELKIGQHRNEIAQSKCFRKIYENALVDLERENQ